MSEDEMKERLEALERIMLWHVIATDGILRGHMGVLKDFIADDLQNLKPADRASDYGMQMQRFLACLEFAEGRAQATMNNDP
jgi:hypothetical protein